MYKKIIIEIIPLLWFSCHWNLSLLIVVETYSSNKNTFHSFKLLYCISAFNVWELYSFLDESLTIFIAQYCWRHPTIGELFSCIPFILNCWMWSIPDQWRKSYPTVIVTTTNCASINRSKSTIRAMLVAHAKYFCTPYQTIWHVSPYI